MNIITRLLSKENQSFKEHMDSFSVGTTWYQLIRRIDWVSNKVIVRTTASMTDKDKVRRIAGAVFSWANDKTLQDKLVIKYVVILGHDDKEIVRIKNPVSRKYFKV